MSILLQKDFVKLGILNSYTGAIVDEYQDCTVPMHRLIVQLKALLPCRVLGDDLQGIFGFRDDPLIGWCDVTGEFANNLGALETPYRWIKAENNEALGRWLLSTRSEIRQEREPDYRGSPIERRTVRYSDLGPLLVRLTHEKQGRICVIGPKARPLAASIETTLVNNNYRVLEPNELSALRSLIIPLSDGSHTERANAALKFLTRAHGGLPGSDKTFIEKILRGENQRPLREDRRVLCEKHTTGTTPQLVFDLLEYTERIGGTSCKLKESVSALKCIVEEHRDTSPDLKTLYADEIGKRKYQSRSSAYRCIGSTLLVKGLEFDHVVILRDSNWQQSWGNHKDLYVALTRGSKMMTLMEITT
jgi:DNA helicase-2/ATP-dependent DNA helicase PcrA